MRKQRTFKLPSRRNYYVLEEFKTLITNEGIDFNSIYDSKYHEVKIKNPKTQKVINLEPRLTIYYKEEK